MVATRNLQVSVKKAGGLTMKTLEGILSKVDGVDAGEKVGYACGSAGIVCPNPDSGDRGTQSPPNVQKWMKKFPD